MLYIGLIVMMASLSLILTAVFLALSALWYLVLARKAGKRESAFFHMVGNLTNREIVQDESVLEREGQASTLIYPGVAVPHAIPHIIIPGEHSVDIVPVRNKFGIIWNDEGEVVYTAFCLVGTRDERHFHLKARTPGELRSVMVVAERKRE